MIYTYRPRHVIRLDVPKVDDPNTRVTIIPKVITSKWTKNNHLNADELTVTIGWEEGGIDPRFLKNSACQFYMWDDNRQNLDNFEGDNVPEVFLRFTGVCTKVSRKQGESTSEVTLTFQDYTTMFIHQTPFSTDGMPEYKDTLRTIWTKICDHTGSKDPISGKIRSSVAKLRNNLEPTSNELDLPDRTLESLVNKRFHATAKPTIHQGANAWQVWQYCVGSLGLVSYIDKDACILMSTTEHYNRGDAPAMIYGSNILDFEENSDVSISGKGVMLKSFDPLEGRVIEAVYPPPGDDRLKVNRVALKRATKEGRDLSINDVSGDYEEFEYHRITDQAALDNRAKEAYEEYSRQQVEGTLKTMEMAVMGNDGNLVDVLSLRANDAITVKIDPNFSLLRFAPADRVRTLVESLGYNEGLARIIVQNLDNPEFFSTTFHVTTMDVSLEPEAFSVEIKYHNLVSIKGVDS